jgi:acyl-CoA thioesterase
MDKIRKFFENDRFATYAGIKVVDISPGRAMTKMKVEDRHLNGIGTVHGGALFTLADFTFALAANSYGRVTVAINANISYLKAVKTGTLIAEARELSKSSRISNYTVKIKEAEGEELVAVFQGMAYRKKAKLKDLNVSST